MRTKDREQTAATRQMLRANAKHPSLLVNLPMLCEVWSWDGKAYVFPGDRPGVVVCDWFMFMRYVRRHVL